MPSELLVVPPSHAKNGVATPSEPRPESPAMIRFTEFLNAVREWAGAHERVAKVYILADGELFNIYVVSTMIPYDFELRKRLTDLLFDLTDRGHTVLGSLIPDGTPEQNWAYFNPDKALTLYRQ